jgi:NADH-quinone oxidoreductase subunit K
VGASSIYYDSTLFLGFSGLLINRRNILLMLLSLELTFLTSSLNFIISSSLLNFLLGSVYGILIILIVVADTAIGLSMVVLVYRGAKNASVNSLISLRG